MGMRGFRRGFIAIGCVLGLVASEMSAPRSAVAYSGMAQGHGFDTCAAPSSATMDKWWPGTPFFTVGIYLGGANRGCAQPNLTKTWIDHQQATGWGLLPIWFGPQMGNPSCTDKHVWNSNISTSAMTAYNQGYAEARSAYLAAAGLGFALADMPLIYDLEAYSGGTASTTTCRNAAKSFLKGWADYLEVPIAQRSGVYGSACGSHVDDFASDGNAPDFIWFADWSGNPHTDVVTSGCIAAGHWVDLQRHKQFEGGHRETWNGVTVNIDSVCADGPTYFPSDRFDPSSDCS